MINEEKVKELYHVALYDTKERKEYEQVSRYYMKDYLVKEVLKSFFAGTIAFMGLLALYIMYNMDVLLAEINSMDIMETAMRYILLYVAFMLAYIFVTILVYALRYTKARKRLCENEEHLKKVYKMYEREEKIKL